MTNKILRRRQGFYFDDFEFALFPPVVVDLWDEKKTLLFIKLIRSELSLGKYDRVYRM